MKRSMYVFYALIALVVVGGGVWIASSGPKNNKKASASTPTVQPVTTWKDAEEVGVGLGSVEAPVTVVEFADLACPYCAYMALKVFPAVESAYIETGKVRWIFVDFPLPSHRNSFTAAVLTHCAGDQGKYWDLQERFFERMNDWAHEADPVPALLSIAEELNLDTKALKACLESGVYTERVRKAQQFGLRMNIQATPSFFINGRFVEGAMPLERFQALLDEMLAGS